MDVELSGYFSSLPSIRKKLLFLRYEEIVVAIQSLGKRSIRFRRFVDQSLKTGFDELHFGKPVLRQKLVYFFGILSRYACPRMKGKMPEELCFGFIKKYSDEQTTLTTEIAELEAKLTETESKQQSADDFIRNIKKYLYAPELTREMCYELLDRVVIVGATKNQNEARIIDIVDKVDIGSVLRYKFRK